MFNLFVFAGVVTGQHEELAHQDQLYQGPRAITGTVSGSLLSSLGGECHHGCQSRSNFAARVDGTLEYREHFLSERNNLRRLISSWLENYIFDSQSIGHFT